MLYQMRQKLISLGDDFTIRDADGNDVYVVDGRAISLGDQAAIRDTQGNELAYIKQKLISLGAQYEIHRGGELRATVKQHLFSFLRHRFTVDVPGPDDLEAAGDLLGHEYTFTRAGREVARVSRRWFTIGDTYGVETEPGEDDVLILASAVVIDMARERRKDD